MKITRETPINFIVFNANIDKKTLYNGPIARMCMDSWKRAFPNLNIINIDITEEIANMNEFSKVAYNQNLKNYTTDPLRLYYINQYDNCVYCDCDVILYDFNSIVDLMNKKDSFIIQTTGTFVWNKYKNNKIYIRIFNEYDKLAKNINQKDLWIYNDGVVIPSLVKHEIDIIYGPVIHVVAFFIDYHIYNYIANKYYLYSVFIKFKRNFLTLYPNNESVRLQNRNFKSY